MQHDDVDRWERLDSPVFESVTCLMNDSGQTIYIPKCKNRSRCKFISLGVCTCRVTDLITRPEFDILSKSGPASFRVYTHDASGSGILHTSCEQAPAVHQELEGGPPDRASSPWLCNMHLKARNKDDVRAQLNLLLPDIETLQQHCIELSLSSVHAVECEILDVYIRGGGLMLLIVQPMMKDFGPSPLLAIRYTGDNDARFEIGNFQQSKTSRYMIPWEGNTVFLPRRSIINAVRSETSANWLAALQFMGYSSDLATRMGMLD